MYGLSSTNMVRCRDAGMRFPGIHWAQLKTMPLNPRNPK
jgi:hypothetical protein